MLEPMNRFVYAGDDPVNMVDPSGASIACKGVVGIGIFVIAFTAVPAVVKFLFGDVLMGFLRLGAVAPAATAATIGAAGACLN
jgi:hypothetical protein